MSVGLTIALVDGGLRVLNVVAAQAGYQAPAGLVAVLDVARTARVGDLFDPILGTFTTPAAAAEERRAARVAAIQARRAAIMAAGAPYLGRRIEVDDATRANLAGMALTALMAVQGVAPWPAAYAQGWITLDNGRLPLPEPGDGILLATAVGSWYGGLVQHARDLKDAVIAAEDPDAVAEDWSGYEA